MTRRTELLLAALMAVAVTLICYGYSLRAPLMWDDMDVVTPNGVKLAIRDIPSYFTPAHWLTIAEAGPRPYRPLRDSYLAVLTDLGDGSAAVFHIGNLALQIINVFLVFLLARRLLPGHAGAPAQAEACGYMRRAGPFLAAAIFATHPMHTEVVAWTKNCAELLALMLSLLSALAFMRSIGATTDGGRRTTDETNPNSKIQNADGTNGFWLLSFLLYGLALLCKESALPLPGLLILWALLWLDGPARKRAVLMTLPLWFAGIAYSLYQHSFLTMRAPTASSAFHLGTGAKLLVCAETYGAYLLSLFFPLVNQPLPEFWPFPSAGILQAGLMALLFAAVAALLIAHILRRNRASFGFWWLLMALGPVANLVQFNSARPIAEQRLYLPSVGFALLIGAVVCSLQGRALKIAVAAGAALALAFGALSYDAGPRWLTEPDFWRWTVRASPNLFLPHQNLGNMYAREAGQAEAKGDAPVAVAREKQAQASDLRAMWLNPSGADITYNLANSYNRQGDFATAAVFYRRSLRYAPSNGPAHFGLARCYLMLGKKQRAIEEFRTAARLDKQTARGAQSVLAQLYYDIGDKDQALSHALAALANNPKDRAVHLLAARIFDERKDYAEAAEHIHEALANRAANRKPEQDVGLYLREGRLWSRVGEFAKAEAPLREAAPLAPNRADIQLELGLVELRLDKIAEAEQCLKPLVDQNQGGVEALVGLAQLRAKQGNRDEAVRLYEAALKASPGNADAVKGLDALRQPTTDN